MSHACELNFNIPPRAKRGAVHACTPRGSMGADSAGMGVCGLRLLGCCDACGLVPNNAGEGGLPVPRVSSIGRSGDNPGRQSLGKSAHRRATGVPGLEVLYQLGRCRMRWYCCRLVYAGLNLHKHPIRATGQ